MESEATETAKVEGGGERGSPSPDEARRELEEQFNVQRARMKELFLQKEEDMQRMIQEKQQLESEVLGLREELQQLTILSGNQRSEIQNLQLLVSETVEVSTSEGEEVRRLRARNQELEQHLAQLRHQISQQEVSLAPATFVRSLARKLGADSDEPHQNKKNAEEGDLTEPLEMEIAALKKKLRETDAQLQEALKYKPADEDNKTSGQTGDSKTESELPLGRACDMCRNYEKQLVDEQALAEAARDRASKLQIALQLATEELEGVRRLHNETVVAWHHARAACHTEMVQLRGLVQVSRAQVRDEVRRAQQARARATHLADTLAPEREQLQHNIDTLEKDNATLIGKFLQKAAEMQNDIINLPDNVEGLQMHTLQLREQLIQSLVGRERAVAAEEELRAQLLQLTQQVQQQQKEADTARRQLKKARDELDHLQTEREQMQELGDKLRHSNDMIEQLLGDKKRLQEEVMEIRNRVSVLQQELDNSEKVQQDFVRLSQSLQVQLQRIREADTEVRWQHDEDVSECPTCHATLNTAKKKVHCRHCGRIFCSACVCHAVCSGPRGAPARVCAVCRTLLQPHTAPYFSTQPPHSPD